MARTFEQRGDNGAALSAYAAWLVHHTNQAGVSSNLMAQAAFDLARVSFRSSPDARRRRSADQLYHAFPRQHQRAPGAVSRRRPRVSAWATMPEPNGSSSTSCSNRRIEPGRGTALPRAADGRQGRRIPPGLAERPRALRLDHHQRPALRSSASPIPVPVVAEAYLARGDLFLLEPRDPSTNPLAGYAEATNAFAKGRPPIPSEPNGPPRAWGRLGDCHLQLATADPQRYVDAAEAYQKVVDSNADAALRSMAEVALGLVREKQAALEPEARQPALYDAAMTHYLNVFYEKNLRPNEVAEPGWLKQAGLNAVKLAESLKRWDVGARPLPASDHRAASLAVTLRKTPRRTAGYRSTSPMTMSTAPRITTASASVWPRHMSSRIVRWTKLGARTR